MATYFTKSEARTAARTATIAKSQFVKASAQILKEDRQASRDSESFDVFLSHSSTDADLVLGVKRLLEARGLKVYVDWDTDTQLDRSTVSSETAELLRRRMRQSASLIYLATEAASTSKWMPWELGYFDGLRSGQVAVMPLMNNENDKFSGQEYLGLYPKITKDTYQNTRQKDVFVEGQGRWTTLREFNDRKPNWRSYATSSK
ncbi:toll/interleukin-1 receptor domain-containing protein [Aromatoleum buckelii]|uniref:TIR domain-containing protein n=1 Tax=Aromatoleum buckelii TaxID=200254 RepID=A0ABX1N810_9RHOO|nr:toll/interleukin-1 receptor domain-containing protein [Aromatoleum buckelii]MCK0513253.1 toll/interleukin-1 receptor domain-containing protein [Aromatoleum buckelii]